MLKSGDLVEIVNVDGIIFGWRRFRNGDIVRLTADKDGDLRLDGHLVLGKSEYKHVRKVAE